MATLSDVAAEAGVSITTVSRVLHQGPYAERISDACVKRVREAAERLGYTVNYHARSMKRGFAETIGLALDMGEVRRGEGPEMLILNPYFTCLIAGAEAVTHNAGFALTLMGPGEVDGAAVRVAEAIRQHRFDAGILAAGAPGSGYGELLAESPELPLVALQPKVKTSLPSVDFNIVEAMQMMVEHLLSLGHRDLLYVGPGSEEPVRGIRRQIFLETVAEAGATGAALDVPRVESGTEEHPADVNRQRVETRFSEQVAQGVTATAVACYNDNTAMGVCRALLRRGRSIPGDVSVMGIDNTDAKECWPPLTTIDHRFPEMGQRAAELALEMANGDEETLAAFRDTCEVFEPLLIVRESTGPVPAR